MLKVWLIVIHSCIQGSCLNQDKSPLLPLIMTGNQEYLTGTKERLPCHYSKEHASTWVCNATFLFKLFKRMWRWALKTVQDVCNQVNCAACKKICTVFRCASISWFQIVSQWVTDVFRLAHLRVFQSYFQVERLFTGRQGYGNFSYSRVPMSE